MIKLEEHKFFEFQRKMDVVPFSIAKRAVEEALDSIKPETVDSLEQAMEAFKESMKEINTIVTDIDKLDD